MKTPGPSFAKKQIMPLGPGRKSIPFNVVTGATAEQNAEALALFFNKLKFQTDDWRARFLRMQDEGKGLDPDAAGRTDRGDGVTGDNPGTKQPDAIKTHIHNGKYFEMQIGTVREVLVPTDFDTPMGEKAINTTTEDGKAESRPTNIYVKGAVIF